MATNEGATGQVCRIGLISRIDFGSEGFRQALLELAKEDFRQEDVHFVILAGGLVSARAIKEKQDQLKRQQRLVKAQIKDLRHETSRKAKSDVRELEEKLAEIDDKLDKLGDNDYLADQLAKLIPHFVDKKGEEIRLHIVASPAYDGGRGEEIAQLLAHKRPKDVRVYKPGNDTLHIMQAKKKLEVLVPEKAVWMRGDYMSTAVERVLKDREKERSDMPPDMQVVGCFGVCITKPQGELPRPYVSVPVLHKLADVRVVENQIGVRVMEVWRDRTDPVVRNYSYKDLVGRERMFINPPAGLSPAKLKIVQLIQRRGKLSTGIIADGTGLSRETVEKEAMALVREGKKPLKTWPGLIFYKDSKRWDLDSEWMKRHLRYPPSSGARQSVRIAAYGCPHFGSTNSDIPWFLETAPKVILENDVTVLVGAGDFIEGLKHNLVLRGEVYGGLNNTQQEILAGEVLSKVNIDVFRVRFAKALTELLAKTKDARPSAEQLTAAIESSLLMNVMIPGNHDLWVLDFGCTPLVTMKDRMAYRIVNAVEDALTKKGLCLPKLADLVRSKLVEPFRGRYDLPNGLRMSVLHPHMARAKTTSIRPQEMLDKERGSRTKPGSHVIIGANFHVGEHLELWDGLHGQRICLQLGTLKHRTDFEDNKLKIVDQGFAFLRVDSVDGRIVRSEATFYSNDPDLAVALDRNKVFDDLLVGLGLQP